jgi:hypothetical protein
MESACASDKRRYGAHHVIWHGYRADTGSAARFRPVLDQGCFPPHTLLGRACPRSHANRDPQHLELCLDGVYLALRILLADFAATCDRNSSAASCILCVTRRR